ncbi:acyl-CoA N-acyltransferase [Syncephalis plumigaleata]|nr:acyl-CoA N-acyltransferase [Syncephalis plumigaleata]
MSLQSEILVATDATPAVSAANSSRRTDRLALVDITVNNVGFFNDICVAAVCCRKEEHPTKPKSQRIYIMTLGVLAPYRKFGMGGKLLDYALEQCKTDTSISEIYLHVQEGNDDALDFYKKRGFIVSESVSGYYTQIQPDTAYVLTKSLE